MTIKEIYEKLEGVGVLTFSTIYKDEVHSRIAHLNGYDENGIYFRTMWNKPFARQVVETEKVTLCGASDQRVLSHDENGVPEFPPGYTIRLIGQVKPLSESEVRELAKVNEYMRLAEYDMDKYPSMKKGNFVIHMAKGEIFDFDFEMVNRDHKVLRERFSFGGMTYNEAGPRISDACIECGACLKVCSFKAIVPGTPYKVNSSKCDDCGSCIEACPVNAIDVSMPI